MVNDETPRLMAIPADAQTRKPEDLVDQPITILSQEPKPRRDAQGTAQQWVVRLASGEVAPYWAPGTWPPIQVQQWFEQNPHTPLPCILRKTMRPGAQMFMWELIQREADSPAVQAASMLQQSVDDQLAEAGL